MKDLIGSEVRMRDVAALAGVSVSTVSNVINHPHLVAPETRGKVAGVVAELGFQPNVHAKALREGGPEKTRENVGPCDAQDLPLNSPGVETPVRSFAPAVLEPGGHLRVRVGKEILAGTVDAVMPDGSCFWIWADGGLGRRMISTSDIASMEPDADG